MLDNLEWKFNLTSDRVFSLLQAINKLIENKSFIFDEVPKEYDYKNKNKNDIDKVGAAVFVGFTLEKLEEQN